MRCTLRHDDVIKWTHLPRYWPFVRGIHKYPVNSPHKGQWRGALMFALNKRLSKQSWGWWFETSSCPLWRHCNGVINLSIKWISGLRFTGQNSIWLYMLLIVVYISANITHIQGRRNLKSHHSWLLMLLRTCVISIKENPSRRHNTLWCLRLIVIRHERGKFCCDGWTRTNVNILLTEIDES